MTLLVTGAAGYIGSVVTETLCEAGLTCLALDNLWRGHREAVDPRAEFARVDLADVVALEKVFQENRIEAVVHLAGSTLVPESMAAPGDYFRNNMCCGLNLLNTMVKHAVLKMVFSSTCAIYAPSIAARIDESCAMGPQSAYGESKLMFEKMLRWFGQAHGLRAISLRYFNAAGASILHGEHHDPETHLIPIVFQAALGLRDGVQVFGTDYATADGSCVRDYVHVIDIASAHVLALEKLENLGDLPAGYNLGSGKGYSVLEVVRMASEVSGVDIRVQTSPRRPGDPDALVSSSTRARKELGWQPDHAELRSIMGSAWEWHRAHPQGYLASEKTSVVPL